MSTTLNGRHGAHNDRRPADVQASAPTVHVSLSRVGVTNVEKVIRIGAPGGRAALLRQARLLRRPRARSRRARTCRASRRSSTTSSARSCSARAGFKAEQLAQRIAERVRERQDALRAEVTIAARYPEHKPAPVSGIRDAGDLHALRLGRRLRARHAPARRRRRAGHDRVPVRAAARRRRARASASRPTASPTTRSSASSRPSPSPRTTSAASARSHRLPRGLRHRDRGRRRCWTSSRTRCRARSTSS